MCLLGLAENVINEVVDILPKKQYKKKPKPVQVLATLETLEPLEAVEVIETIKEIKAKKTDKQCKILISKVIKNKSSASIFKKSFGVSSFIERVNLPALSYIIDNYNNLKSDIEKEDLNDDIDFKINNYNPLAIVSKYHRIYKQKNKNYIEVKYSKSSCYPLQCGRWFANNSLSLQSFPRVIRHTISKGLYIDLDFINCHPTILNQLCSKNDIECPILNRYVEDRPAFYNKIRDDSKNENYKNDDIKKMFICALNGSKKYFIDIPFWVDIVHEFKYISDKFASLECNKSLLDECKAYKDININARVLNRILCNIENECLECLVVKCDNDNLLSYTDTKTGETLNIACLIFDGGQIPDTAENREIITKNDGEYLKDCSKSILEITGYDLAIIIKPFDEALTLPDGYDEIIEEAEYIISAGDDTTASKYIIEQYGHLYKKCNGINYICDSNIWGSGDEVIKNTIFKQIQESNILILKTDGSTCIYSHSYGNIEKCYKLVLVNGFIEDPNFINNSYKNTINYLPFLDGIYSFVDKKLYTYNELPNIHFTQKIYRKFPVYNAIDKEELLRKVLNPIYSNVEELDHLMHVLSRALSGNIADKKWYVGCGSRDCGKGITTLLLKGGFGCYIDAFDSKCLISSKFGDNDAGKALGWVVGVKDCRLLISNEIDAKEENEDKKPDKLNGNIIKTLASGGDEMKGRLLYKDNITFTPQFSIFIMCNELPEVSPADAKDNLELFNFKSKFVNEEDYIENTFHKKKDHNIKAFCKEDKTIDAFILLILDAFNINRKPTPESVKISTSTHATDEKISIELFIIKNFIKTDDKKDRYHTADIGDILKGNGYKIQDNKITNIFNRVGIGIYNKNITIDKNKKAGLYNLKYIGEDVKISFRDDDDDDE